MFRPAASQTVTTALHLRRWLLQQGHLLNTQQQHHTPDCQHWGPILSGCRAKFKLSRPAVSQSGSTTDQCQRRKLLQRGQQQTLNTPCPDLPIKIQTACTAVNLFKPVVSQSVSHSSLAPTGRGNSCSRGQGQHRVTTPHLNCPTRFTFNGTLPAPELPALTSAGHCSGQPSVTTAGCNGW